MRLHALLLLLASLSVPAPGSAQSTPKPPSCAAAEHRQFDYWVGEWDVSDQNGKRLGENRITRIHDGCALLEEWRGNGGVTGSSLNIYDRERGKWHQTWVDGSGGLLLLDGGIVAGAMTLQGESVETGPPVKRSLQRIRWQPQSDGRVRQLWEASTDGGKTWTVAFDGWYSRRK